MDVGPKFGNQPNKTCKDSPVIRIFNYTCDADDAVLITTLAGTYTDKSLGQKWYNFLKDEKGLTDTSKVCVFQPRVQVLDNWGWCTGECDKTYKDNTQPSASNKTPGCYSEYPYNSTLLTDTKDQCSIEWNKNGLIVNVLSRVRCG